MTPGSRAARIVALGDSTTAGTPGWRSPVEAPPSGEGDPASQYAWWLMRAHPEWEVLNRGRDGERSDQIRARFARDVLEARPGAVIVIAGVNDIYQGLDAAHVTAHLSAMYAGALAASIPVVAGSILPYDTATPEQNARMHEVNAWIRSAAGSTTGLYFADTREAVAHTNDPDRLGDTADGLHPTVAGYHLMALALLPVLERALRA